MAAGIRAARFRRDGWGMGENRQYGIRAFAQKIARFCAWISSDTGRARLHRINEFTRSILSYGALTSAAAGAIRILEGSDVLSMAAILVALAFGACMLAWNTVAFVLEYAAWETQAWRLGLIGAALILTVEMFTIYGVVNAFVAASAPK